jgi:hydrogenase/urease accessory protein HupE
VSRLAFALLVILLTAVALPASAHGMRTAYLEIVEVPGGRATVHLRASAPDPSLGVDVEAGCSLDGAGDSRSLYDRAWLLDCPGGITGHALSIHGLGPIVSEVVVWTSFADGTRSSRIVKPDDARFELRSGASGWSVVREYVRLGVVHILTGYDHLLFLLLLVLLLRRVRSVLLAETAFTLSHSLSFSATALGWIHVSSTAAEACIALSLVLLAADVKVRGAPARAWRGARMAFVFGLVHGLGFAGGLREIGLPERAVAPALVSFGAGVELGQVAFLAVVLGALHLVRHASALPRIKLAAVYAAGSLSAFWLLERAAVCLMGQG